MTQTIHAHFDGKAIIPDTPLQLPAGQRLRIQIETIQGRETDEPDEYPLARIGKLATAMGVTDLASQHQQYARRAPTDVADR
jgi:hypothetical protein